MKALSATTSPLGRPIDFKYRSNVLAVAVSALVGLVFFVAEVASAASPASPWWVAAGAVFLAWAVARELDPDHTGSATVAMAVMGMFAFFIQPSLLLAFGALTGLRLTAGTVGLEMKRTDMLASIAIGGLLGLGDATIVAVPVLAFGIIVIGKRSRASILTAAAAATAAVAVFLVSGGSISWSPLDGWAILLGGIALLSTAITVPADQPRVGCDVGDRQILGSNLTLARWAALAVVGLAFLFAGAIGIVASATLVAASTGVAVTEMLRVFPVPRAARPLRTQ